VKPSVVQIHSIMPLHNLGSTNLMPRKQSTGR